MKIYVVTHKEFISPNDRIYSPIQVGNKDDLGYLRDNTGDNISYKNKNYCELTAAYWIWKNSKEDVVGLVHYRRYFVKKSSWFKHTNRDLLDKESIDTILKSYDIIVPKKIYLYNTTVEGHYNRYFKEKDYKACRDIIKIKYPEYIDAFEQVSTSYGFSCCNMMIARKNVFDDYHKWLFDILFELESNNDLTGYDDYQLRIYGFLSERLFNVWLLKNSQFKVKYMPVVNSETWKEYEPIKNNIKKILTSMK